MQNIAEGLRRSERLWYTFVVNHRLSFYHLPTNFLEILPFWKNALLTLKCDMTYGAVELSRIVQHLVILLGNIIIIFLDVSLALTVWTTIFRYQSLIPCLIILLLVLDVSTITIL